MKLKSSEIKPPNGSLPNQAPRAEDKNRKRKWHWWWPPSWIRSKLKSPALDLPNQVAPRKKNRRKGGKRRNRATEQDLLKLIASDPGRPSGHYGKMLRSNHAQMKKLREQLLAAGTIVEREAPFGSNGRTRTILSLPEERSDEGKETIERMPHAEKAAPQIIPQCGDER